MIPPRVATACLITGALLAQLSASPLHSQIAIGGQVTDTVSAQPIAAALVRLMDEKNTQVAVSVTDANGGYLLLAPSPGGYTLIALAWGYESNELTTSDLVADTVFSLPLAPTASDLEGEFVRGVVIARETNTPISVASVVLLDDDGKARQMATTDGNGLYGLPIPRPGMYSLRVDAAGTVTMVTDPFEISEGQTAAIEVRLTKQLATELEAVTVSDEAIHTRPLYLRQFEYRRQRGFGEFVTREEIEEKAPRRLSDALRLVPSVKIVRMPVDPDRPLSNAIRNYTVRITGLRKIAGDCVPGMFLDGIPLGPIDEAVDGGPDFLVYPSEIEGIEIYRPSTVPPEFSTLDSMCGVIVVWTRRGG